MSALALDEDDVTTWLAHRLDQRHSLTWNAAEGRVEARLERRLGAIVLARVPDPAPDPAAVAALLLDVVRREGLDALPLGQAARALLTRGRYAGLPALDEGALLADLEDWLAPLLAGRRDLAVSAGKLHEALENRLDWNERQTLDRLAPAQYRSPAGTSHAIDYAHEGGPAVELRVQALFGLDRHPMIGQPPRPLLLAHLARRAADPDHRRSARVLARIVARRGEGHERPLSAPSLARPALGRRPQPQDAQRFRGIAQELRR
jgi:ATP-dependent helicase HrpB